MRREDETAHGIERNRTQAELRKGNPDMEAMFRVLPDTYFRLQRDGTILAYQANSHDSFYIPPEAFMGKRMQDVVPTDVGRQFTCAIEKVFSRKEIVVFDYSLPMDSVDRHFEASVVCSAVDEVVSFIRDITDKKSADNALVTSELRFRLVARATYDAIWDWDVESDSLTWNDGTQPLFGYEPDAIGPDLAWWIQHIHPEDRTRVVDDVHATVESGRSSWCSEYQFHCHDGSYATVTDRGFVIRDETGKAIRMVGAMNDITDQRIAEGALREANEECARVEEQLRVHQENLAQASRLSAIGATVSGLAHELSQPLSAVSTYADACKKLVEAGKHDDLGKILTKIAAQAERAGKTIHRVRRFIREETPHRSTTDLNELVRETIELLDLTKNFGGAAISTELDERIPFMLIDSTQIQQVLANLIQNAIESMELIEARDRMLTIQTKVLNGNEVTISVRDAGTGIEGDTAGRLFDAFYTTKKNGMGLGLSISQSIAEAHGGRLWATRNDDRGLTVHLSLPIGSGNSNYDS